MPLQVKILLARLHASRPRHRCRPELEANAAGIGHISLDPGDPSAVVRAVPLFLSDGEQLYPNLALEALRVAQGASTYVLAGATNVPNTITMVKIGEFEVPVTAEGELWLYITPDTAEQMYSSRGRYWRREAPLPGSRMPIRRQYRVLSGHPQQGFRTSVPRPLDRTAPGVSLHAQTVEQISVGTAYSRAPDWANGLANPVDRSDGKSAGDIDHVR